LAVRATIKNSKTTANAGMSAISGEDSGHHPIGSLNNCNKPSIDRRENLPEADQSKSSAPHNVPSTTKLKRVEIRQNISPL
ncbi:MAG: hypothetical protein AAGF15_09880, partial [Pseudomonadota bacterium]